MNGGLEGEDKGSGSGGGDKQINLRNNLREAAGEGDGGGGLLIVRESLY